MSIEDKVIRITASALSKLEERKKELDSIEKQLIELTFKIDRKLEVLKFNSSLVL